MPPCTTSALSIRSESGGIVGGGRVADEYIVANHSQIPCILSPYPAAMAPDASGKRAKAFQFVHSSGVTAGPENQHSQLLKLSPGQQAWFEVVVLDGTGLEDLSLCKKANQIQLRPASDQPSFPQTFPFNSCGAGSSLSFYVPGRPPWEHQ